MPPIARSLAARLAASLDALLSTTGCAPRVADPREVVAHLVDAAAAVRAALDDRGRGRAHLRGVPR